MEKNYIAFFKRINAVTKVFHIGYLFPVASMFWSMFLLLIFVSWACLKNEENIPSYMLLHRLLCAENILYNISPNALAIELSSMCPSNAKKKHVSRKKICKLCVHYNKNKKCLGLCIYKHIFFCSRNAFAERKTNNDPWIIAATALIFPTELNHFAWGPGSRMLSSTSRWKLKDRGWRW